MGRDSLMVLLVLSFCIYISYFQLIQYQSKNSLKWISLIICTTLPFLITLHKIQICTAQTSSSLPLARLFESPPLEGLALTQIRFAPNQKYMVYLKKAE